MSIDDEIDLRPYIYTILRYKWLILALAAIFAFIGLGVSLLTARKYTASANLLLTRNRATLELASDFPTVSEPLDFTSRMEALISIATSDALAQQTIQIIGDDLPEELRSVEQIQKVVSVSRKGDSILVSVSAENPELSAAIANAWAQELAQTINIAYGGGQRLSDLQTKLQTAEQEYNNAQAALEEWMVQDPTPLYEQQVKEARELLDLSGNDRSILLTYYFVRRQSLEQIIQNASALKQQVQDGAQSNAGNQGDALAVLWARMMALDMQPRVIQMQDGDTAFGSTEIGQPGTTLSYELVVPDNIIDSPSSYGADIDALIRLAQSEMDVADQEIERLSDEILAADGSADPAIKSAADRIQSLDTQIENARAQGDLLTKNRDIAWNAYQALLEKETEIKNAALSDNFVFITSPAIPPAEPDSRGTLFKTAAAGLTGLVLGLVIAFALEWRKTFQM